MNPIGSMSPAGSAAASGPGFRHKRDLPLTRLGLRPGTSAAAPAHVLLLDRQETASDGASAHTDDSGARPGDVVTAQRVPHVQALHTLVAQSSSTWRVVGGLAEFADAVVFEDSVAVLREGQLVTARGLGALLWDILEADGPCTSAMLLDELIVLLGDDPRAAERLEAALAPLSDEGLLAPGM